jgi:hypothetical protein
MSPSHRLDEAEAVAATRTTDLDPQGVLARIAASAPPLTEGQRSRIGALIRPSREDHFTAKLGAVLRATR